MYKDNMDLFVDALLNMNEVSFVDKEHNPLYMLFEREFSTVDDCFDSLKELYDDYVSLYKDDFTSLFFKQWFDNSDSLPGIKKETGFFQNFYQEVLNRVSVNVFDDFLFIDLLQEWVNKFGIEIVVMNLNNKDMSFVHTRDNQDVILFPDCLDNYSSLEGDGKDKEYKILFTRYKNRPTIELRFFGDSEKTTGVYSVSKNEDGSYSYCYAERDSFHYETFEIKFLVKDGTYSKLSLTSDNDGLKLSCDYSKQKMENYHVNFSSYFDEGKISDTTRVSDVMIDACCNYLSPDLEIYSLVSEFLPELKEKTYCKNIM